MDSKISVVIDRQGCYTHDATKGGEPCWWIVTSQGHGLPAVCNKRVRGAGFNGRISAESLRGRAHRPKSFS